MPTHKCSSSICFDIPSTDIYCALCQGERNQTTPAKPQNSLFSLVNIKPKNPQTQFINPTHYNIQIMQSSHNLNPIPNGQHNPFLYQQPVTGEDTQLLHEIEPGQHQPRYRQNLGEGMDSERNNIQVLQHNNNNDNNDDNDNENNDNENQSIYASQIKCLCWTTIIENLFYLLLGQLIRDGSGFNILLYSQDYELIICTVFLCQIRNGRAREDEMKLVRKFCFICLIYYTFLHFGVLSQTEKQFPQLVNEQLRAEYFFSMLLFSLPRFIALFVASRKNRKLNQNNQINPRLQLNAHNIKVICLTILIQHSFVFIHVIVNGFQVRITYLLSYLESITCGYFLFTNIRNGQSTDEQYQQVRKTALWLAVGFGVLLLAIVLLDASLGRSVSDDGKFYILVFLAMLISKLFALQATKLNDEDQSTSKGLEKCQ